MADMDQHLNSEQFKNHIPAYIEYPATAEKGDDEGFVSPHELGTAQFLETRHDTHGFRLHDGRLAWVDNKHYQPTKRNFAEKYEREPLWVSEKWQHEEVMRRLFGGLGGDYDNNDK